MLTQENSKNDNNNNNNNNKKKCDTNKENPKVLLIQSLRSWLGYSKETIT